MSFMVHGAGLGFRRDFIDSLEQQVSAHPYLQPDFLEVAPENWLTLGGHFGKRFRQYTERYPFIFHGLSLNLGGAAPLDEAFIKRLKSFMDSHQVRLYSEHLSYCGDDGHLYDLMPIPFTEAAVNHVAERVQRTEDILGQRIAIENASYYARPPGSEMSELEFIQAVLDKADCLLLLDVNNIYVNSINHRYDAEAFLKALPSERIAYAHVAGHYNEAEDLIVDTHGSDVIDPVWQLLKVAYQTFGVFPTLLERDFNYPPMLELLTEMHRIRDIQAQTSPQSEEKLHVKAF